MVKFFQNVVKKESRGHNELLTIGNDPIAKGSDLPMTGNDSQ
jgi:hypothetical protein